MYLSISLLWLFTRLASARPNDPLPPDAAGAIAKDELREWGVRDETVPREGPPAGLIGLSEGRDGLRDSKGADKGPGPPDRPMTLRSSGWNRPLRIEFFIC